MFRLISHASNVLDGKEPRMRDLEAEHIPETDRFALEALALVHDSSKVKENISKLCK